MRTAYDLSPLYGSMIGVDRMAGLIDAAMRRDSGDGWPPYDIEKTGEDAYRITLAAAGFSPDDIEVVSQPNLLIVTGHREATDEGRSYLHKGLARRSFERRFELADYVVVKSANYENGLLTVDLAREVPEALKPRRIEIAAGPTDAKAKSLKAA